MSGKLTPKQAIFAAEYLIDSNATRAAIAAGFAQAGAHVRGARLLKNAKVAAAIADAKARVAQKYEVSIERTVSTLAKVAYHDLAEMVDEDGVVLPVQRMGEAIRTVIAGLEVETTDGPGRVRTVTQKVKIADRIRALELLGKYQKIFTDRIEHDGRVTLEQLVCGNGPKADDDGGEQAA